MSTADLAKGAYNVPAGDQDELLSRLVNEIFRSPAAGLGPQPSFAGPSAGGIGASPGAATTSLPKPLGEPVPVHAALPAGAPPDLSAGHVILGTAPQPSVAGPSFGGVGLSPGAAGVLQPRLEPHAAQTGTAPPADPLDRLVADAVSATAYTGPSLGGIGISPGVATTGSPSPAARADAPLPASAAPTVDPLGLAIPGADLSRAFPDTRAPGDAGAGSVPFGAAGAPASSYYFVERAPESGDGVKVPAAAATSGAHGAPASAPAGGRDPAFASAHPAFDVNAIRRDFPILSETVNGKPLIWLDNAATTQKPRAVIERLACFYEHENSNIHRAAHELAARATDAYEDARETVRRFLNAPSTEGIVFVRGTTEAINLVAQSWGRQHVGPGDEIIVTHLEHHANIVPWQLLAWEKGAKIRVAPVDDRGQVLIDEYQKLFNARTRLVSFTQVSNALGTVTPARDMIEIARRHGVRVLLDGAQSVSHMRVDVEALDPDFFVFSGHKIFGPTGIGVLYGKPEVLNAMQPWQGGGNMIADVTFERTLFQHAPLRFEAGTGNIADAVGLAAAIRYVETVGIDAINRYEHGLIEYATRELGRVPGLAIVGTAPEKAGVISFVLDGHRTEDIGAALNAEGIAVRSGHHCAQPILRRFGHETTVRPSFAFYNTCGEIDALVAAVLRLATGR